MNAGIFKGIENDIMGIEYQTTVSDNTGHIGPDGNYVSGKLVRETRIFSYPVGGKIRDTFFRGFGPREGTIGFVPDMPKIGQKVRYDGPAPDMAGHLMVDVYPDAVDEIAQKLTQSRVISFQNQKIESEHNWAGYSPANGLFWVNGENFKTAAEAVEEMAKHGLENWVEMDQCIDNEEVA
jgi:hypothetical protein